MSVPKDKLFSLINQLNDNDAEKIIDFTEALIIKREKEQQQADKKETDFDKYRGVLRRFNINPDKLAKELRSQWKRNIS